MTKIAFAALPLLFLAAPAVAQVPSIPPCSLEAGIRTTCLDKDGTVYVMPQIPDEDLKRQALALAYKMNGNSMVGAGYMIDLTTPVLVAKDTPGPAKKAK